MDMIWMQPLPTSRSIVPETIDFRTGGRLIFKICFFWYLTVKFLISIVQETIDFRTSLGFDWLSNLLILLQFMDKPNPINNGNNDIGLVDNDAIGGWHRHWCWCWKQEQERPFYQRQFWKCGWSEESLPACLLGRLQIPRTFEMFVK